MSKKKPTDSVLGPRAMELVMRDVLGGMEDLAVMKSFESINNVFEIVSITPSEAEAADESVRSIASQSADIIPLHSKRETD